MDHSPANLSSVDRLLRMRMRSDLEVVPVAYSGQTAYVVKDPLTLELFYLSTEEHFLLDSLRQPMSLGELRREFEQRFSSQLITHEAIQRGVERLYEQGLLESNNHGQGEQLFHRKCRNARRHRWQSLLSLLSIRLASFDATRLVDTLHARLHWCFSWPMLVIVCAVVTYAASILVARPQAWIARLPDLLQLAEPRYWPMWIATVAAIKVVHELGHAIVCKHFGARCHEMGLLLLGFLPCLYCDVSDSWRLPDKWQRIAVSAAGMIVECFIAACALILWWHLQPGLLQTWCLSVVVVCSIGTVAVNANPLLRYDGYYILSDLLEVPNLSGRARRLLPATLEHWLLGQPRPEDPLLSPKKRRALAWYAIAMRAYLAMVLIGVLAFLLTVARPYHLENLVYTLATATILGLLFEPAAALWRRMKNPAFRVRIRGRRLASVAIATCALLAMFFFWPIASTVRGPIVLVPAKGHAVFARAAGELHHAALPGTLLRAGDVVARLVNADLNLQISQHTGEHNVRRVRVEQLENLRPYKPSASARLPTAQAALADAKSQLNELRQQASELTLIAPMDGTLFAVADRTLSDRSEDQLATWQGSLLDQHNRGCWVEPGTAVGMIGDPSNLSAIMAVDQTEVAQIQAGQAVTILLESGSIQLVKGNVVKVTPRGAVRQSTATTADTAKVHLVQIDLEEQDSHWLVGFRGQAKIVARRTTLGQSAWNGLHRMLRLPW